MKKLLVVMLVFLAAATSAQAATITLDFSGTVDLSGAGGATSNTFSGSVAWDPTAAPVFTSPEGFAQYTAANASFTLNSTDYSSFISDASLFIGDDCCGSIDFFNFGYAFFPGVNVTGGSPPTDLVIFAAGLVGPLSMFGSTALPGSLDFLGSVTTSMSEFTTRQSDFSAVVTLGSLNTTAPTAVPEPATLTLTALGLAGVLARSRQRRKPSSL